jgi:hypothetical protein
MTEPKVIHGEVVEEPNTALVARIPVHDIRTMAEAVAKSGLFGVKNTDQAMALMLVAQAEGLHPAIAARDYNIIDGKPSKTAEAMQREFQKSGGIIQWNELTDERASATFSHPQSPSPVTIEWDMARAKQAELTGKHNWKKYPRAMLRARVVSEGVRSVFPGATSGMYTPEEVRDFDDRPKLTVTQPEQPKDAEKMTITEDQKDSLWNLAKLRCNEEYLVAGGVKREAIMREVLNFMGLKNTIDMAAKDYDRAVALIYQWEPGVPLTEEHPNAAE